MTWNVAIVTAIAVLTAWLVWKGERPMDIVFAIILGVGLAWLAASGF